MPFNQQVSFPCELTLHTTPTGLRLYRAPIRDIKLLHQTPDTWTDRKLNGGATLPLEPSGDLLHIVAEVGIPDGARLTFNLGGATLVLTSNAIESGSAHAPF